MRYSTTVCQLTIHQFVEVCYLLWVLSNHGSCQTLQRETVTQTGIVIICKIRNLQYEHYEKVSTKDSTPLQAYIRGRCCPKGSINRWKEKRKLLAIILAVTKPFARYARDRQQISNWIKLTWIKLNHESNWHTVSIMLLCEMCNTIIQYLANYEKKIWDKLIHQN